MDTRSLIQVLLVLLFSSYLFYMTYNIVKFHTERKKKIKNLFKIKENKKQKNVDTTVARKVKRSKNPFKNLIEEFSFFVAKKQVFIRIVVISYILGVIAYFLIVADVVVALALAIMPVVVVVFIVEAVVKRKKMGYIKGFANALGALGSSLKAGNSFENAITSITKRKSINEKIKHEFTIMSNNIKSNYTIDQSLEFFYKRNNLFDEFAMFVTTMQFFTRSGGKNVNKIFGGLQTSLNEKIKRYSEIESKIVTYNLVYNLFLFGFVLASFILPFIQKDFYDVIVSEEVGYIKLIASVLLALLSLVFFKGSIKKAADN